MPLDKFKSSSAPIPISLATRAASSTHCSSSPRSMQGASFCRNSSVLLLSDIFFLNSCVFNFYSHIDNLLFFIYHFVHPHRINNQPDKPMSFIQIEKMERTKVRSQRFLDFLHKLPPECITVAWMP